MTAQTDSINPTPGDLPGFWGRDVEIAWLTEQLALGQRVLVIYGPRRAGKTVLLRHVLQHPPDGYLAIYLDAGKAGGWSTVSPLLQIAGEIGRSVREQTRMRTPPPDAVPFAQDSAAAWHAYLRTVNVQLDRRQLLLLVDNAERASSGWLSVVIGSASPVVLAAQGRERLAAVLPELYSTPLHSAPRVAPAVTLGPLDSDAAESLVRALVTPQTQIDPWAVRRILEITSNQPHYIRLFCRVLLDCCAQHSPLTPSDVEEALPSFFDAPQTEFVDAWESLPSGEQYVLSAFGALKGHGGIATSYDVQKSCTRHGTLLALSEVNATLDRLIQRRLLERLGANSYRFTLELFRLWVARHRPPEQVFRRRPWRLCWQGMLGNLGALGQSLAERWTRWAIVAGLVVVGAVLILPMLLRASRSYPTSKDAPATPSPRATVQVTQAVAMATLAPMATSVPTPPVALPGHDLALMSRSNRDAPWQMYTMSSLTGERQRLTQTTSDDLTPRWSPDGRKLVFASYRSGEREVYVMDLAAVVQGAGDAAIVNLSQHRAADWQPAWSPDGKQVAFSSYRDGNWEIYAVQADGTDLVRLTNDPATDFSPSWSPDGTRLLFMSRRRGDADLFVLDLATSKLAQLTRSKRDEYEPAWSPDREWIAFVTQMDDQSDIWVMHADGSDPVNLTQSRYADDFEPAWFCGSEWLLYVSYTAADGNYGVFRMRRDGTGVTRVTESKVDNLAPDWRSTGQCP